MNIDVRIFLSKHNSLDYRLSFFKLSDTEYLTGILLKIRLLIERYQDTFHQHTSYAYIICIAQLCKVTETAKFNNLSPLKYMECILTQLPYRTDNKDSIDPNELDDLSHGR